MYMYLQYKLVYYLRYTCIFYLRHAFLFSRIASEAEENAAVIENDRSLLEQFYKVTTGSFIYVHIACIKIFNTSFLPIV